MTQWLEAECEKAQEMSAELERKLVGATNIASLPTIAQLQELSATVERQVDTASEILSMRLDIGSIKDFLEDHDSYMK